MPRYRTCKNCPAYKYAFLSKAEGKCALQFEYFESDEKITPLEECTKPKNIIEMNIFAQKRGIELPGCDMLLNENEYNVNRTLKDFARDLMVELKANQENKKGNIKVQEVEFLSYE